ncbi:transposase family protein [Enterococcus sp. BWB1-3]|nr:transposase family protein [Enterococcus sp. BWB1-3]
MIGYAFNLMPVLLNDVSQYKTILFIKKQRFFCKACQRTFLAVDSMSGRQEPPPPNRIKT